MRERNIHVEEEIREIQKPKEDVKEIEVVDCSISEDAIKYKREVKIIVKEREYDYLVGETFEDVGESIIESHEEGVEIIGDRVYYYYVDNGVYMYFATDVEVSEFEKEINKMLEYKEDDEEMISIIEEYIESIKNKMYTEEDLINEVMSITNAEEIEIVYPDLWTSGDIIVYIKENNKRKKKVKIGISQDGSLFNRGGTTYNYFYHPDELKVEDVE